MNDKTKIIWNSSFTCKNIINSLLKELNELEKKINDIEESKVEEINVLKLKIKKLEKENMVLRINDHLNSRFLERCNNRIKITNI